MANLTAARPIVSRQDAPRSVPVYLADGYTFYTGGVLTQSTVDGYARPATGANNGTIICGLLSPKDGSLLTSGKIVSPASGVAVASQTLVGVFDLDNDGSVTQALVGSSVYLQDDHTVGTTTTSGLQVKCVALNSDSSVQVAVLYAGVLAQ